MGKRQFKDIKVIATTKNMFSITTSIALSITYYTVTTNDIAAGTSTTSSSGS